MQIVPVPIGGDGAPKDVKCACGTLIPIQCQSCGRMLPERSEAKVTTIFLTVVATFVVCLIGFMALVAAFDESKKREEADRKECLAKSCPAGQHPAYFDVTKDCDCKAGVIPK